MMGSFGWGMGLGWFGMLSGLVFWVLLLVGAVILVTRLFPSSGTTATGNVALEALRLRYARGEIDQAEFETARRALGL